jgi:NAD(P)H dehydrogenase (quinone)
MEAYQNGVMAGINDKVERLPGEKPTSVREFALAHADQLNPKQVK